jgi:hypothetical protein
LILVFLFLQEGKHEGVDLESPPNSKIFDPTNQQNANDVRLLANRRLNQTREAAPPITVNFSGLADLLKQNGAPVAPAPAAGSAVSAKNEPLPPPMELALFCDQYHLSNDIKKKLGSIHVSGPHVLRLITDADLRGEGTLSIGELASLRDAHMRWIVDVAN